MTSSTHREAAKEVGSPARCRWSATVVMGLVCLLAMGSVAPAGDVHVWILAGQSNAPALEAPLLTNLNAKHPTYSNVMVTHAQGGTSLHPAYTKRPTWHPSVSGKMYDGMISAVNTQLSSITAAGDTPIIAGMFWMQGEQDAKATNIHAGLQPPPQPDAANLYGQHLQDLIAATRTDLGVPDLMVVIGETTVGDDPSITYPVSDYNTNYGEFDLLPVVQAQQANVAASDVDVYLVDTDESQLGSDYVHFSPAGIDQLAYDMVQVPEPASLALLAVGGLLLVRRRRGA